MFWQKKTTSQQDPCTNISTQNIMSTTYIVFVENEGSIHLISSIPSKSCLESKSAQ